MNIARNTNRRSTAMGRSRDLGLSGAGKGDAPRYTPNENYRNNHESALPFTYDSSVRLKDFTPIRPGVYRKKY